MKKRTLALILAAAVTLTSLLSGCGETSVSGTSETSGESSGVVSQTSSEPEVSGANAGGGKLKAEGITTAVGTPREETLIVETAEPTDAPGQFNTYMPGTTVGFGIHQLLSAHLWEIDTGSYEQFGEVAEGLPEQNEDFTEHLIKIRKGIKWSDGEDLTAEDVAFTFNMIMDNPNITSSAYYKSVLKEVSVVDDYTVKMVTYESFPRITSTFGVLIWGNDFRIVPEHIYGEQADVTTFKDEQPVVAGPYVVKSFDPLGKWILYERREDWENSVLGVVAGTENVPAKYVWFRYLGDDNTRQMAMINNEVDILCEVTPEMLTAMTEQNPEVQGWYPEFPYAFPDDPCAKGLIFSNGKGAPFNSPDFRWGIALALDMVDISMNIFGGVGLASPYPLMTASSAMDKVYGEELAEWAETIELDLGDGTTFKPWDSTYADQIAERLAAEGKQVPDDPEERKAMFGRGWWKHDTEAATKLFQKAGLELKDGEWYLDGEPFTFTITYLAETELQASRGAEAAYDQLTKFGFNCTLMSESSGTWGSNLQTGQYDIAAGWPNNYIIEDWYNYTKGFTNDLIVPLGEKGSGDGMRWDNQEFTDLVHEMEKMSPTDPAIHDMVLEAVKIATMDMADLPFLSGVKYVPTNNTYWENYPTAEDPYAAPWWWCSTFKYIVPHITPVAAE
jgi:peptide/nickel transport system substrate-binding protein